MRRGGLFPLIKSRYNVRMDILRYVLIGIVIGIANVIPGVSGGTLAVVFNVYDKFVNAITLNVKKIWANRRFVIPILCGMMCGVLLFSKLITVLYEKFPVATDYFFTGLIIGSIPMLVSFMLKKREEKTALGAGKITGIVICALAGLALMLLFMFLEVRFSDKDAASALVEELPAWTLPLALRILAAGILGAVAMIIPGISGSLLMLIMGVYPIVVKSIPAMFVPSESLHAITLLLPNGVGVLIGLLCGAQLLKVLLKKFPNQMYALIFGLLCGSVVNVFPGFGALKNVWHGVICFVCLLSGVAMAFFSTKFAPEDDGAGAEDGAGAPENASGAAETGAGSESAGGSQKN